MHQLIRLLVTADTAAEALANADSYASEMTGASKSFDWYDMNGRWGDSKAYGADSVRGKKLITSGMQATRREFDKSMNHIRYMLDHYSDDQIYADDFQDVPRDSLPENVWYLSRYMFSAAGGNDTDCYVWGSDDVWGGRIEHDKDLERALADNDKKVWVVPVDFHH